MSLVRSRVASSDWCASRKVVSVTASAGLLRNLAAKAVGPRSSSRCLLPGAGGASRSTAGSAVRGSTAVGATPNGRLTVTSAR